MPARCPRPRAPQERGQFLELSKRELSQSTRNNTQIVLRSVLRFAKARGYIARVPEGLPRLKPIGQCILEIPTDEEVDRIPRRRARRSSWRSG
ncbi:hypothetical protein [Polyangium sp. y55x31]|uniref:hypothetical protein n=1 Tax=Polyangium sp. y55x31 TaxID=3042688 RepID=UPI002482BCBF|nr:hypothetical protein [Polyangium sp. y55x31]MDI1476417.1 hypothetical protein [Polyangium sp. y55x31]